MRLILLLCLTAGLCAQELTRDEAVRLGERFEQRVRELRDARRRIEIKDHRSAADREALRWYDERIEALRDAQEVMALIEGFDYIPDDADRRVCDRAMEILAESDPATPAPPPAQVEPQEAPLSQADRNALQRLERLHDNGLITEYQLLRERIEIIPNLEDIERLLAILARTYEQGLLSDAEFNRQVEELEEHRRALRASQLDPDQQALEDELATLELAEQAARLRLREAELARELAELRLKILQLELELSGR